MKFGIPPGFTLPALDGVAGLHAAEPVTTTLNTTYFDTPDLRLARWGASLRMREGEGWTVKLPDVGDGVMLSRAEYTFPGSEARAPTVALELLTAYLRGASVRRATRMRTERTTVVLSDDAGRTIADIVEDEVTVFDGRRVATRFREVEVEFAPDSGTWALDPIRAALEAGGAGEIDLVPKHVRALGPRALAGPELQEQATAGKGATVREVVSAALAGSVARLIRHDAGVRLGEDPESVHQARVATRRLRSDLHTFRDVLEPGWAEPLRAHLAALGRATGAVRDADVLLGRMERLATRVAPERDRRAKDRLLDRLRGDRDVARAALLSIMRERDYGRLLDELVASAQQPQIREGLAQLPAREVLGVPVRRAWEKLRADERAMGRPPTDEELHELRIRAKRARYAAEAVVPAFGKRAAAFARAAGALQEVLGDHQDAVMAGAKLREASRRAGSEAFLAGQLAAHETIAAAEARGRVKRAWKELSRKRMTEWLPDASVIAAPEPEPAPEATPEPEPPAPEPLEPGFAPVPLSEPEPEPHPTPPGVADAAVVARAAIEQVRREEAEADLEADT